MANYTGWLTLRELDTADGFKKGYFFRIFKRMADRFDKALDYVVLDHRNDAKHIECLRASKRIYGSSVNVILISPALALKLRAASREYSADGRK